MPISWLNWSLTQFQAFVIILTRVSSVLFLMPILGTRYVPNLVKIGLALVVSLILLPLVKVEVSAALFEPVGFGWFLIAELMIGLILGLTIKLIFAGIQLAGEFMGYQMGLSMASLFDPQSGVNNTVTAEFNYLVALLFSWPWTGTTGFLRPWWKVFGRLVRGGYRCGPDCMSTFCSFPERCS